MKIIGNTVGTTMPRSDWNQTDPSKADYIKNKPNIPEKEVYVQTEEPTDVPDGTLWVNPNGVSPSGTAATSLGITGAAVGQIGRITAVDSDGKPTAWEPVDMPSGGGGEQEKIIDITFDEEFSKAEISIDLNGNPFKLSEFVLWFKSAIVTSGSYNYYRISVNEKLGTENLPSMNTPVSTSFSVYGCYAKIRQDGTVYAIAGGQSNVDFSDARFYSILGLSSISADDSKICNYGDGVYKFNLDALYNIFAVGTRLIVYGVRA